MGTDNLHHKKRTTKKRIKNTRNPIPYILIVCEGTKTEPNYFNEFKIRTKNIAEIKVQGEGKNTDTLVKEALRKKNQIEKEESIKFDQVWCVFDRDSFPANRFNNALSISKSQKIQIAYSNESFELWYLLHFDYISSSISREDLNLKLDEKMKKEFNCRYEKNSCNMYKLLEPRQDTAIKNAQKLEEFHKKYSHNNPEKNNPSTTVYKLVLELNKYIK